MSKKAVTVNAETKTATVNRKVYTPEQFLDKAAAKSSSSLRNDENNFRCLELADTVVEGKNLENAEFYFSKFTGVKFVNCDLNYAAFKGAELHHVTFERCKLERSEFNFAAMDDVSFTECFLDSGEFDFASGTAAFAQCSMENAEFTMCGLDLSFLRCNLNGADLNGCHALKLHAEDSDFTRAELNDCVLSGSAKECLFPRAEFNATDGSEFSFVNCSLRDIDADGATGISERDIVDTDDDLDEELNEIFN